MTKELPILSILIPIHARDKKFVKSFDSILIPDGVSFEILVYNDGSKISIKENLSSYKYLKNTQFFDSTIQKGISHALNFLIKKSKGIYLFRFDADDFFLNDRIDKQLKYISEKGLYSVCFSSVKYKNNKIYKKDKYFNSDISLFEFKFHNPVIHPTVVFLKNMLNGYKYSELNEHTLFEDYELFHRMRSDGIKFFKERESLLIYNLINKKNEELDKRLNLFKYKINKDNKLFFFKKIIFRVIQKLNLSYLFKFFSKKNESKINYTKDKISIIIPTYNSSKTIERALKSVLSQEYQNFEILIIDDGSNDNTLRLLKKFKNEKLKVFKFYNSKCPGFLRNMMIDASDGEYIAFLDSDDCWLENKLKTQINFMKKNKFLISATRYVSDKDELSISLNKKNISFKDLIKTNIIGTSSVIAKKTIFSEFKFHNNTVGYPEDYDLWLRILSKYDIGFLNKTLHIYQDKPNESIRFYSKNRVKQNVYIYYSITKNLVLNKKPFLFFLLNFIFLNKFFNIFKSKF